MTDTDKELYELCRKAYELTGWGDEYFTMNWWRKRANRLIPDILTPGKIPNQMARMKDTNEYCPLYTSDYLLEKLPRRDDRYYLVIEQTKGGLWVAYYLTNDYTPERPMELANVRVQASTPLKALLELTIALHEAGELQV